MRKSSSFLWRGEGGVSTPPLRPYLFMVLLILMCCLLVALIMPTSAVAIITKKKRDSSSNSPYEEIRFRAMEMMDEPRRRTLGSSSFVLSDDNNLLSLKNRERWNALMNRPTHHIGETNNNHESTVEPKYQFIIKLAIPKSVQPRNGDDAFIHVLSLTSSDDDVVMERKQIHHPLMTKLMRSNNILANHVVSVVAKASELDKLNRENPNLFEWVGTFENHLKSTLNFQFLEDKSREQWNKVRIDAQAADVGADNDNNQDPLDRIKSARMMKKNHERLTETIGSTPLLLDVVISLIPSLEAIQLGKERQELQQIVSSLNALLESKFTKGQDFTMLHTTGDDSQTCEMSFSPLKAAQIGQVLLSYPHVHFIERKLEMTLHNRFASTLMQQATSTSPTTSSTPFYDMGIYGSNQVVAVSDSGLDHDNCFFYDSKTTPTVNVLDTNRRKVVYYSSTNGDNSDGVDGHGTHVCGAIVGSIENQALNTSLNRYHGMAPGSKIWFNDIQAGNGGLSIPNPVTPLFQQPYDNGVRIFSNSWGCGPDSFVSCNYDCSNCQLTRAVGTYAAGSYVTNADCKALFGTTTCCNICNVYSSQCQTIDKFLWDRKDAVILFSQGNSGYLSEFGNTGYPAVSKNTISVGAHHTSNAGFVDGVNYDDFLKKMQEANLPFTSTAQCCAYSGTSYQAVRAYCCPTTISQMYSSQSSIYNENNLASFSSRGPACGGRIKPDVVAVGHTVISTHSDGSLTTKQCGSQSPQLGNSAALLLMSGTSMATPLTAGVVSLLREYFQKYAQIANPSGTLLKAALIHSATPLTGSVAISFDESNRKNIQQAYGSPNFYDGFGKVQIGNLLKDTNGNALDMKIWEASFTSSSEVLRVCLRMKKTAKSPSSFKATLAWYDMPSSIAVEPALIHDLDLIVNQYTLDSTTNTVSKLQLLFGNGAIQYGDDKNNVERVSVSGISNSAVNSEYQMVSLQIVNYGITANTKQPFTVLSTYPKGDWDLLASSECVYQTSVDPSQPQKGNVAIETNISLPLATTLGILGGIAAYVSVLVAGIILALMYRAWRATKKGKSATVSTNTFAGSSQEVVMMEDMAVSEYYYKRDSQLN
ncbi:hypothetical protein FDP41_006122 [Naegleria fowleri]|uniref:Peptidase S8/S53 domain-containing protein n=1 Tax=Naegleria fowleri TaxID=5763 RepID=A0A6A5BKG9_NAEFO|nr:uncharacterized protein FDP41_006122 [Naegleria fowleri]KAF0974648.1 hypothetical protein FDP41_006122 [Naegleria fowleri]